MLKFIKRFFIFLALSSLVVGLSITFINIPEIISWNNVKKNNTADTFDHKVYEGWAFAYYAIKRENNVLYSNTPTPDDKDTYNNAVALEYPANYLPDLIEDFGIAVQKPYAGNYVFETQKSSLSSFYNKETKILTDGINSFKPISKDINANDANVIKTLNTYSLLVDRLSYATSLMTLEESKNIPIGEFIKENVDEKYFSDPLAYGQVATEYLEMNLNKYKGTYEEFVNDSDNSSKLNTETVKEVKKIMGIGKKQ